MGIPRFYYNSQSGAPQITGVAGALVGFLDAVLVTGFPTQSITSLTHSAGIITGTKVAHGYTVDTVITISGAVEDEYNGQVTILTVPDADTFTYAPVLSNPSSSPATGTILGSTTTPGLGWQLEYTGTNLRTYRPRFGTRMRLGVTDTATYYSQIRGGELASSAGTNGVTVQFPWDGYGGTVATGGLYVNKTNNVNNGTNRAWRAFGDDKTFYWFIWHGESVAGQGYMFGDFTSYKAGDAYNCVIVGKHSIGAPYGLETGNNYMDISRSAGDTWVFDATVNNLNVWIPRVYTQAGQGYHVRLAVDMMRHGSSIDGQGTLNTSALYFPGEIDGGIHMSRKFVCEPSGVRGHLRGFWASCGNWVSQPGGLLYGNIGTDALVSGSGEATGRVFRGVTIYSGSQWGYCWLETSDTWD